MLTSRRWLTRGALCAALAATSACDSNENTPADGVYVGRNGDVMVAVVADDDLVTVYACDGTGDQVSLSTWFYGQLDGGLGTLAGDVGDVQLDFIGSHFTAYLRVGGDPLHVSGERVEGDDLGLFWGEYGETVGGWIFAADGEQRGAVLKRNTGDLAAFVLPAPGAQTVTLDDSTALSVTRLAAPRDLR